MASSLLARFGQHGDELIEAEDDRRALLIKQPSEANLFNVRFRETDDFCDPTPVILQQPQGGLQSGLDSV